MQRRNRRERLRKKNPAMPLIARPGIYWPGLSLCFLLIVFMQLIPSFYEAGTTPFSSIHITEIFDTFDFPPSKYSQMLPAPPIKTLLSYLCILAPLIAWAAYAANIRSATCGGYVRKRTPRKPRTLRRGINCD